MTTREVSKRSRKNVSTSTMTPGVLSVERRRSRRRKETRSKERRKRKRRISSSSS